MATLPETATVPDTGCVAGRFETLTDPLTGCVCPLPSVVTVPATAETATVPETGTALARSCASVSGPVTAWLAGKFETATVPATVTVAGAMLDTGVKLTGYGVVETADIGGITVKPRPRNSLTAGSSGFTPANSVAAATGLPFGGATSSPVPVLTIT